MIVGSTDPPKVGQQEVPIRLPSAITPLDDRNRTSTKEKALDVVPITRAAHDIGGLAVSVG